MQKICEGLNQNGVFIFTTGGVDVPGEKSDSCMGPSDVLQCLGYTKNTGTVGTVRMRLQASGV